MKGFGIILILAGVLALAAGLYGFYEVLSHDLPGGLTDWAIDTFNASGLSSALTAGQSIQVGLVRSRVPLAAAGVILILIGTILFKRNAA